jgi:hypothetical protein
VFLLFIYGATILQLLYNYWRLIFLYCSLSDDCSPLFVQFQITIPSSNNPNADNNMDRKPAARPFPTSTLNSNSPAVSIDTVPTSNLSQQQYPSGFDLNSQSQQFPWMTQAAAARGFVRASRSVVPPPVVDPHARLSDVYRELDVLHQMIARSGGVVPARPPPPVTVNVPKQRSPPNLSGDDSSRSLSDQTVHSLGSASSWSQFLRNNPINQDILDLIVQNSDNPAAVVHPTPDAESESNDEEDDEEEDA